MKEKHWIALEVLFCAVLIVIGCVGLQNKKAADTEKYPYVQRLEPTDPVDGKVEGAAGMLGVGDVADSSYFPAINYYDGEDLSDTLILLDHFKTYQQTSERSCGASCVIMTVNYLTGEILGENMLDKEMDIRYIDNVREDGSYGATTASIVEVLKKRGLNVQTSVDTQDEDGYSFEEEEDLVKFVTTQLKAGKPIIMESVEWGALDGFDRI